MILSISNIAWQAEDDREVYRLMRDLGFTGLEIAPTRLFPQAPYEKTAEFRVWAEELRNEQGFGISSMQSIWYGRQERLFGSEEERTALMEYTKEAIRFAEAAGCGNLVFGCPRNRQLPDGADGKTAVGFFREIGDYAAGHGTAVSMEANPPIYNTNYVNDTASALALIREVGSAGFRLNLDVGTMICNGEDISVLKGSEDLINHVHISEPGLKPIEKRKLHCELAELLNGSGYDGYVSIEVGRQERTSALEPMMAYVRSIFG